MSSTVNPRLMVPLGSEAHRLARQFAAEQNTPQKGTKVYLNTLAIYAVHSYLKWLQIETDLSQGDSWHLGLRSLFNVADLVIPGFGKLECCPVLPQETTIFLPPEVTKDRIGYVAVQVGECLNEVELLGFFAADTSSASEQILIADLQPLDTLLDCIPNVVDQVPLLATSKTRVNLSCWLQNTFGAGWQTVEALFSTEVANPAFGVRSGEQSREIDADNPVVGVSAGKLIDWGIQLAGHSVTLIVKVVPKADEELGIRLRVYPAGEQVYLPSGLQLIVVDESGTRLEVQARSADNWIQLEFSGELEERFSVKVALGNVSITEDFVI